MIQVIIAFRIRKLRFVSESAFVIMSPKRRSLFEEYGQELCSGNFRAAGFSLRGEIKGDIAGGLKGILLNDVNLRRKLLAP